MATLILRPTGAGAQTQQSPSAGNNWQNVDESSADDDTTYNLVTAAMGFGIDSYVTAGGLPAGATGISVAVTVRAKASNAFSSIMSLGIRTGGTNSLQAISGTFLTTSYVDYTHDFSTTNPVTETDWTVDDINGLELCNSMSCGGGSCRNTIIFATITYTAATPTVIEATAVSATFAVPAPSFTFSAQVMAPSAVSASFAVPAPTFVQTGGIASVIQPSPVYATFVVAQASFSFGTLALTPSPVVANFVVPTAEISVPTEPPSQGPGAWGMSYTRRRRYGDR